MVGSYVGMIVGAFAATFFALGYFIRDIKHTKAGDEEQEHRESEREREREFEEGVKNVDAEAIIISAPDTIDIFRIKSGKKKGLLSYKKFVRE